jgi:hypothetical protein
VSALLERLEALAAALARRDDALGLLALGSVGAETDRLDAWSDLDFFVLVRDADAKARYIASLDWLADALPLAWHFRNTTDGHKALAADGTYCELAVFVPHELPGIPYAPGRWVWQRDERVDPAWATPCVALPAPRDEAWLVGEALSNLLVGLMRHARGEHLAAMRLVQVHALDRVLELRESRGAGRAEVRRDPFAIDRRVEQRQVDVAPLLRDAAGGIGSTPVAARALLAELRRWVALPEAITSRIESLAAAQDPT